MEHSHLQASKGRENATESQKAIEAQRHSDPFDNLLGLEEEYYQEGYDLGVADGTRAGRIEGRVFGMEKGFEKFAEMGKLAGRAHVWAARLPAPSQQKSSRVDVTDEDSGRIPCLSGSDRLRRHVERLVELTDPESLETKNTEDGVNECDERLAGARAKVTLIERIVGEDASDVSRVGESKSMRAEDDVTNSQLSTKNVAREMEDFSGLPPARGRTGR